MLERLTAKPRAQLSDAERGVLAWAALMDFGFEFFRQAAPQIRPDEDPLEALRRAWRRKSDEHLDGNERMLRRLAALDGR